MAMITNVAVIIFSSNAYEAWDHASKILLFLCIEHGMLAGRLLIGVFLPQLPREVKVLRMQQQVIIHKHLNLGGGGEDDHETRTNAMITSQHPPIPVYDQDDEDEDDLNAGKIGFGGSNINALVSSVFNNREGP